MLKKTIFAFLVIVFTVAILVVLRGTHGPASIIVPPQTSTAPTPPRGALWVPPFDESVAFEIRGVARQPLVNVGWIHEALGIIIHLRGTPELQTRADRAIMDIAAAFYSGQRLMRVVPYRLTAIGSNPAAPTYGRLGYSCGKDQFAYDRIQSNVSVLAISVYHELFHAVDCYETLGPMLDPRNPVVHEAPAYAAEVRFFVAAYRRGLYRNGVDISAEESSDAGVLRSMSSVWVALQNGTFAEWYRTRLTLGSTVTPPDEAGLIKEKHSP